MPFLGTLVNFVGVLLAGLLGTLVRRGIPERISNAIITAMSTVVVYIGVSGALEVAPAVPVDSFLSAELKKILIMILSLAIGTLIGELLHLEEHLERLGAWVEKKLTRKTAKATDGTQATGKEGQLARGLVSCSLLFCVGAMAVNGAIADAFGNPDIILAKTVIDAIVCFTMATTLGIGCAFSAFFVLAYQGAIAVLGYFLESLIPASTISYMSVTGSLVIIFIGTNMLKITNVKTANMVPAMFVAIGVEALLRLLFAA